MWPAIRMPGASLRGWGKRARTQPANPPRPAMRSMAAPAIARSRAARSSMRSTAAGSCVGLSHSTHGRRPRSIVSRSKGRSAKFKIVFLCPAASRAGMASFRSRLSAKRKARVDQPPVNRETTANFLENRPLRRESRSNKSMNSEVCEMPSRKFPARGNRESIRPQQGIDSRPTGKEFAITGNSFRLSNRRTKTGASQKIETISGLF